jgi:hypothetical protein
MTGVCLMSGLTVAAERLEHRSEGVVSAAAAPDLSPYIKVTRTDDVMIINVGEGKLELIIHLR